MSTESLPQRSPEAWRQPELEPHRGLRLGRYELLVRLASGGMAEVWIARLFAEHGFERLVAIKTIRREFAKSDSFRRMFLDEARLAARIAHASVVEVLDLGEDQGIVYQAMALVEGESVEGLLKRRRQTGARGLPHGIAARIMSDALSGLHAAHELVDAEGRSLNLVHRDVSPQNVLVGVDGVTKIADFGIAKARSRLADETDAGQVKGKYAYMAPEQLARTQIDRRADIFAAGVILWEALTGERLFGGTDLIDTIAKVRALNIPDPRRVEPSVPLPLAHVTMRALAREPSTRFPTAAEMSDALESAVRECARPLRANAKEVGALVADLCAEDLRRRREAVRDAVRDTTFGRAAPVASNLVTSIVPVATRRMPESPATRTGATTTLLDLREPSAMQGIRRRRVAARVTVVVLVGAALGSSFLRWQARANPVSAHPEEIPPAAAAPLAEPRTTGTEAAPGAASGSFARSESGPATAPSTESTSAATASVISIATAPALPSRTGAHAKLPGAHPAPGAPRVKYANPYGP